MFGLPRRVAASSVSIVVSLWLSGCTCGGPYEGDYFDGDRPGPADYKYAESKKGDPKVVGCADGQREGFAEIDKHPRIAGCVGNWKSTKSLRDAPTGKPCGDDGEACAAPADVCAPGWHVCAHDGASGDLSAHTTQKDCDNAGPGRFNAAISHSPTDEINPCPPIKKDQVLPCVMSGLGSEPVCCGNDCKGGKCKDAVWKGKTKISVGTSEGCGAVTADRNAGILCCFDGEGNPTADAKAPDAKAPDAKAEDAKAPDAKAPDAKLDTAKIEAKTDEKKAEETKAEEKKPDEKKAEETKAEEKKPG